MIRPVQQLPATAESDELMQRRPDGVDDDTVEAVGSLSEALEYVERARGHLYSFHQLMGHADLLLGETCDKLRSAGHGEIADTLATDMVGRNVLARAGGRSRWSRSSTTTTGRCCATTSASSGTS